MCDLGNFDVADYVGPVAGGRLLVLVESPHPAFERVIPALRGRGARVVYDLIDDWASGLGTGWYDRASEDLIATRSDVLVASSSPLVTVAGVASTSTPQSCGLVTFWRVAVPLALPGIVAVVVFAFTLAAHEFIYALAFVSPTSEKTISVGVPTELIRGDVFFWQSLEAAGIVVAVPLAFAFTLLLERFITGFTIGAVKG